MPKYIIHFSDGCGGQGSIWCETYEEFTRALKNAYMDAYAEDIWCEELTDEGWVAM